LALAMDEVVEKLFGLWGTWAERVLMAFAVEGLDQVLLGSDLLPGEAAPELVILLAKLEEMLVELDRIDCDSTLLGGEASKAQGAFLSNRNIVSIERKSKVLRS
jgi:hypothetical protein